MNSRARLAIVGGGFTGLTLGYRLARRGWKVTVFESGSQLGGLATYQDYGGFYWDRFYHVILPTDRFLIDFLSELGFAESFIWSRTRTGYYTGSRLFAMSSALDLLRFPSLGFLDKVRLAAGTLYASRITDWRALQKMTVEEWTVRTFGRKNFEVFWKPLLLAKLGESYREVSAVFLWTYLRRLYLARTSGRNREQMGHVVGGYRAVFAALVENIRASAGDIRCSSSVRRISSRPGNGIAVESSHGVEDFDKLIFTGPPSALNAIASTGLMNVGTSDQLPTNPGKTSDREIVRYLGVVCMVLVTREALSPFYTINIADSSLPFTGVIGMSNVVPPENTAGFHLTYFPKYVPYGDPLLALADEEIEVAFLANARRMFPALDANRLVSVHVHRAGRVQPLQTLDYEIKAASIRSRNPDLFLVNTSQFVSDTLNNNLVLKNNEEFLKTFPEAPA